MSDNIDSLIVKHFPFKTFNPGQKEVIRFSIDNLLAGKKHVIISAPTGIGKTAVSATVHKVMYELKNGDYRSTVVTATKSLMDQYQKEVEGIYALMGKANYSCPFNIGPYLSNKCRSMSRDVKCDREKHCEYFMARERWGVMERFRLTNTAFMIDAYSALTSGERGSKLLILDECHLLEEELIQRATISFDLTKFVESVKMYGNIILNKVSKFLDEYEPIASGTPIHFDQKQKEGISNLQKFFQDHIDETNAKTATANQFQLQAIGNVLEELGSYNEKLGLMLMEGEWIIKHEDTGMSNSLSFVPVYASQVSDVGLYSKGEQYLHMSATICGEKEYARSMGISDFVYLDVPNPIPVENRQVYLTDALKVSGQFDREKLAKAVDMVIEYHEKENGIIHTVSFQLANDIKKHSKYSKRMIISNDRIEIMKALGKHNSGAIILSPSLEVGYDFKGDLARWQIIAKVPFAYLGDEWVKLNVDRSNKWYARKAILRMVQASGRAVRGVDDFCSTYILDEHATRLLAQNRDLVPSWYLDSLVK